MPKASFQLPILNWYHRHKRDLPWRKSNDPYIIWLSEVILQQTRVAQGLPYYQKFIQNYPTVHHLALAPEERIMKDWEGLGYYSRARNLHSAAKQVVSEMNGEFPSTHSEILKLKGVGDYTAAAISSFAFNEAHAVLDGNVFRLLARYFAIDTPINSSKGKKEFARLAEEMLYHKDPATYNQAVMEFGALQCVPKNPDCAICPLQPTCLAYAQKSVNRLPVKERKNYDKHRFFNYILIRCGGEVLIKQRRAKDVWKKLYEFILEENVQLRSWDELHSHWSQMQVRIKSVTDLKPHKLSHQTIHCRIFEVELETKSAITLAESEKWIAEDDLNDYAFPKPLRAFLDLKQLTLPLD